MQTETMPSIILRIVQARQDFVKNECKYPATITLGIELWHELVNNCPPSLTLDLAKGRILGMDIICLDSSKDTFELE